MDKNKIVGVSIQVDILVSSDMLREVGYRDIMRNLQDNIHNLIDDEINYKVIGGQGAFIHTDKNGNLIKNIK